VTVKIRIGRQALGGRRSPFSVRLARPLQCGKRSKYLTQSPSPRLDTTIRRKRERHVANRHGFVAGIIVNKFLDITSVNLWPEQ
jgi:hypothetical protein